MKKTLLTLFLAFTATNVWAQSAKVIELSAEDAKTAKSLHDLQTEISQKIEEFDQVIRVKYLKTPESEQGRGNFYTSVAHSLWLKDGWDFGNFEYSENYKFIVPKKLSCASITSPEWRTSTLIPASGVLTSTDR